MEMPRTESEWDKSYTFKMAIFEFINYFDTLFYLAYIRGNLTLFSDYNPAVITKPYQCPVTGGHCTQLNTINA